jgi:hypothetical protein
LGRVDLFQPEYRIIKTAFERRLPKEAIVELFHMKDEIQDVAGRPADSKRSELGELVSDPTTILEEVARNYKPSNEDNIITCQFFESSDDVRDPKDMDKSS